MNGRLFCTETGQMMAGCNEELSRWNRARKVFQIDQASSDANLWILAHEYPGNTLPLIVEVGGQRLEVPGGGEQPLHYCWRKLHLPAGVVKPGPLEVTLYTAAEACNSWILGISAEGDEAASLKSFDGGATWRADAKGFNCHCHGDYIVRVTAEDRQAEPYPGGYTWENPDHPRLTALRETLGLDAVIAGTGDELAQQIALRSWISGQWVWSGGNGYLYPPYDALTILDWAHNQRGHAHANPCRFCVIFGTLYTQCALALGWPAKCMVLGPRRFDIAGGHFISEVYNSELDKWIIMDASQDCHYEVAGQPVNTLDIHRLWAAGRVEEVAIAYGINADKNPANAVQCIEKGLVDGVYANFGMLPRNDYFTSPHKFPIEHGMTDYHETHFVWWQWDGVDADRLSFMPWHSDKVADPLPPVPPQWQGRR